MHLLKQATSALLGTLLILGVFSFAEASAQSISRYVIGNGGSLIIDNNGTMTYGGTVGQSIVGVGGYEPGSIDIFHGFWYVAGTSAVNDRDKVVAGSVLSNWPNPVTTSTTIQFTIPNRSAVRLHIVDVNGSIVQTLIDGETYTTGSHQIMWDGRNAAGDRAASGTYLYKLDAQPLDQGGRAVSAQEQMVLMK